MGLIGKDFIEFIEALNKFNVSYILVGGYAVVLRGYSRSTGDMDIWLEKTEVNYFVMQKAFAAFGLPTAAITKEDFLGDEMDVFSFGVEPNAIDIMTAVKGVEYEEAYRNSTIHKYERIEIRIIHIQNLIQAKLAAGRFKDLNDVEHLKRIWKIK